MVNNLLYKEIIERMNEYQDKVEYDTLGTEILLLALMSIEDSMTNLILKELLFYKKKSVKYHTLLIFQLYTTACICANKFNNLRQRLICILKSNLFLI